MSHTLCFMMLINILKQIISKFSWFYILNPEISPTLKRIQEIKQNRKDIVVCLFREPQFPSRIVQTVIQETNAKRVSSTPGF